MEPAAGAAVRRAEPRRAGPAGRGLPAAAGRSTLVPYREAVARRFPTDWATLRIDVPEFTRHPRAAPTSAGRRWSIISTGRRSSRPGSCAASTRKIFDDPAAGRGSPQTVRRRPATAAADRQREAAAGRGGLRLLAGGVGGGRHPACTTTSARRTELARCHTLAAAVAAEGAGPLSGLADFIAPLESGRSDYLGAFAVTAGHRCGGTGRRFEADHDDYNAILAKALADRLAEAFAERLHQIARCDWGYGREERSRREEMIDEKYRGIRPAPGYPACPDHTEKRTLFDLLRRERADGDPADGEPSDGPARPRSAGCISPIPQARYFAVDRLTRDQVRRLRPAQGDEDRGGGTLAGAEPGYEPEG